MLPGATWTVTLKLAGPPTGLPTCVLLRNGATDAAVVVTVTATTNPSVFVLAATIPAGYAAGDTIEYFPTATVGTVTDSDLWARAYVEAAPIPLATVAAAIRDVDNRAPAANSVGADLRGLAAAPVIPLTTVVAAIRDVDNTAPAANSLGSDVRFAQTALTAARQHDGTIAAAAATTVTFNPGDPRLGGDPTGHKLTVYDNAGGSQERIVAALAAGTTYNLLGGAWAAIPAAGSAYDLGGLADVRNVLGTAPAAALPATAPAGWITTATYAAGAVVPTADPWARALAAGGYVTGTAGQIVLSNLNAAVSSRSTYAGGAVASVTAPVTVGSNTDKTGYSLATPPPTAVQIRQELDANSTRLANLDVAVSTRSIYAGGAVAAVTAPVTVGTITDKTGYTLATPPPTAAQIRQEMDASSARLALLDVAVSTRSVYAGGAVAGVTAPVTVGVVTDKAGYSLATPPPTAAETAAAILLDPANRLRTNPLGYVTTTNPAATGSGVTEETIWQYADRSLTDKAGFATTAPDPWLTVLPGSYEPTTAGGQLAASRAILAAAQQHDGTIAAATPTTVNLAAADPAAAGDPARRVLVAWSPAGASVVRLTVGPTGVPNQYSLDRPWPAGLQPTNDGTWKYDLAGSADALNLEGAITAPLHVDLTSINGTAFAGPGVPLAPVTLAPAERGQLAQVILSDVTDVLGADIIAIKATADKLATTVQPATSGTGYAYTPASLANTPTGVGNVAVDAQGRVTLAPAGLDAIGVETGVNLRQAATIIAATTGGVDSVTQNADGTYTVTFKGLNSPLTRVVATCTSNGSRTGVLVSLPA